MGWPDRYTKRAHAEGYAARSVYKLRDMDAKFSLFKQGQRVLDLGCFPGSFCQHVASRVGSSGLVVGVDIQKVTTALPLNVKTFVCDVFDEAVEKRIKRYALFDVVLSDMAPSTTGTRALDQSRSAALVERAWELACSLGTDDVVAVIKYFQGAGVQRFVQELKKEGVRVRTYKPKASRKESYEMFLILTKGS